jgi:hypothetical protein
MFIVMPIPIHITDPKEHTMIDSSATTHPVIEQLEDQPNLLMGLTGGGVAMLVSAIVWGTITYFTEYQIGWMSIGVGFLVGIAIKFFGRGKTAAFGMAGAVLAFAGCLLGNLIFYSGVISREENISFLEVFFIILQDPAVLIDIFIVFFDIMDIFFYALAAYAGFSTAMDLRRAQK